MNMECLHYWPRLDSLGWKAGIFSWRRGMGFEQWDEGGVWRWDCGQWVDVGLWVGEIIPTDGNPNKIALETMG